MPKIKVVLSKEVIDGQPITFIAPCDCSEATGLKVSYPGGTKEFAFKDSHGNNLTGITELFLKDAYVRVIVDTVNGNAFIQNADTNAYIEDTFLKKAGGTMTGAIAMGGKKITGLGTPTTDTDAATKAYADKMLPKSGGTMTGAIAMGGKKITGLGTPSADTDAATKKYVDDGLSGKAASSHKHSASDINSGKFPLAYGGTGQNLSGIPKGAVVRNSTDDSGLWYAATKSGALYATAEETAPKFGTLPIAQGGTGATTAANARTKLGLDYTVDTSVSGLTLVKCNGIVHAYSHTGFILISGKIPSGYRPKNIVYASGAYIDGNYTSYRADFKIGTDGTIVGNAGSGWDKTTYWATFQASWQV